MMLNMPRKAEIIKEDLMKMSLLKKARKQVLGGWK